MRIPKVTALAAAFLCVLGLGSARAQYPIANVNFIENGDVVTVVPADCGPGHLCAGGFTSIFSTVDGENAHFAATWVTSSPLFYQGVADAYLVEPPVVGQPQRVSDKVHISFFVGGAVDPFNRDAQITIDFVSDSDIAPPEFPPPGVPVLVENGQPQLVNDFFVNAAGAPVLLPTRLTIFVQSDLEPPVGVERSSWQNVKALYR
jgi:hypothetical protein